MDGALIKAFWNCGDSQIIEFAMSRARLNRKETEVLRLLLDDCETQERAAELMDLSTRKVQSIWYSACRKMLSIDWVLVYSRELINRK